MVVLLGGSRALPPSVSPVVARALVGAFVGQGAAGFVVGDAVGADELLFAAAVALGQPVRLFSSVPAGAGWRPSVVSAASFALAASAGVPVVACPAPRAPVAGRLAARSAAAAAAASAGLLVLSSPSSVGSLGAASLLARRGCPVWFVCVGFQPALLPLPVVVLSRSLGGVSLARVAPPAALF